jgi:sigma-B regulation protein RsbU (phosphoserine phosphatase)
MTAATASFLISLIDYTCILLVIAYGVVRAPFFYLILRERDKPQRQIVLTLFFGALSCYGVLAAVVSDHYTLISISLIGPIVGAFIGGAWVGAGAGLIGAAAGLFITETAIQSAIFFAGILAGLYRLKKKETPVGIAEAALFVSGYEFLVHLFILYFAQGRPEINSYLPVTALASTIGVTGFVFIIDKLVEERQTSAAKELIESELRIARNIQMSIVPKIFPPLANLPMIELHAVLMPAREVGGDLYDFFLIDDDHFFFAIGDVSGKGMPAALFMAITRTLLKANSEPGVSPDLLLGRVNNILYRENYSSMFVTLFCGILNIRSGEVVYSNAGHNPPYVYRTTGALELLRMPEGMALGVMEGIPFGQNSLVLRQGDTIVTYTDGVNEAMDAFHNQYSNKRLENAIRTNASTKSREIISHILKDVEHFAGNVEQSDDIAILSLTYLPAQQA